MNAAEFACDCERTVWVSPALFDMLVAAEGARS